MAKFSSEYQPEKRGGGPKAGAQKLREALERKFASGEVDGFDTFDDWLVHKALAEGGVYLQILTSRAIPSYKPTLEPIKIEYPKTGTAVQKAEAVYDAIAGGEISPDVGQILIDALSKMLNIEEITDLKARLERIEEILNKQ